MPYYTFSQNNSGGSFVQNDDLDGYVIIEARNSAEANQKAKDIGIYFDGSETGDDCSCCGDRWYRADESDAVDYPSVYGEDVTEWGGDGLADSLFGLKAKVYRANRAVETYPKTVSDGD